MKRTLPIYLLLLLIFASCGEKKDNTQKELLDKVLAVHDEVMPKMGDIMKYKKELNAKIDALIEAGSEENANQIDTFKKAIEDLDNSHDGMMNWMHGFDRNFDSEVQEEVIAYLKDQMTKIETVGKKTNTALKNAEELLIK